MPEVADPVLTKGLKQARKQPCNFVMLCKGSTVVKLFVERKKIRAKEVKEARTETGASLALTGVVQGDENELVFKVVGEEPTVKIISLRDLITEQTALKLKPRFEVVKELEEIDDESEGGEGEAEDETVPIAPPVPPPTADDPLAPLIATMKSLATHVQAAIQKDPAKKDSLLGLVAQFQKQVKDKDASGAKSTLTALGQALKAGSTPSGGTTPGGTTPSSTTPSGGTTPPGTGKVGPNFWPEWEKAKKSWLDAIDTVNGQLEKLRIELLKVPEDKELQRIAEFGLNAITGDHKVPLQKAIIQVDQAKDGDPAKAIAEAKEMVVEFRDHIDVDERVEACDENPFDVTVTIRATLDPVLAQMEQVLSI